MKKIILCLVVLSIVGCGNKAALDEANAYRITQETIQAGLDAEQIRLAKTEAAKQKAIDDAYWNAVWASSMVAIKRVANFVAYSVGIAPVCYCYWRRPDGQRNSKWTRKSACCPGGTRGLPDPHGREHSNISGICPEGSGRDSVRHHVGEWADIEVGRKDGGKSAFDCRTCAGFDHRCVRA